MSLISKVRVVDISGIRCGEVPLFLICGPCVIEESDMMRRTADSIRAIGERLRVPMIFKSSYTKNNRSSGEYYRGPGLEMGLTILDNIRSEFGLPILSDVHAVDHVAAAAAVLDVIQIPAYLCMETELAEAVALSGKPVNVKHGQFLAPENMVKPVRKLERVGNTRIMVTERGYTFGYNDLVVDPRSFHLLREIGCPVVFDVSHSIRRYGVPSADPCGGNREYLDVLGRAGVAAGVDGLFIEVHPAPAEARCDAASQMPLGSLEEYLKPLLEINAIVKGV